MNPSDSFGQHRVLSVSLRGRALPPCVVATAADIEDATHGTNRKLSLVRFYVPTAVGIGGTSPFSRANQAIPKGLLFCEYIPLLLQLTQRLSELAELFPFVGRQPFSAFPLILIGLFEPIADGLFCGFKPLGELGGRPAISCQFDDSVSEFLWVWSTILRAGLLETRTVLLIFTNRSLHTISVL